MYWLSLLFLVSVLTLLFFCLYCCCRFYCWQPIVVYLTRQLFPPVITVSCSASYCIWYSVETVTIITDPRTLFIVVVVVVVVFFFLFFFMRCVVVVIVIITCRALILLVLLLYGCVMYFLSFFVCCCIVCCILSWLRVFAERLY